MTVDGLVVHGDDSRLGQRGRAGVDAVRLALACYRRPSEFATRLSASTPLPPGMGLILRLANQSQASLDMASLQTRARPEELRDAARLLTERLCFAQGATHYRVLGVEPGTLTEDIKRHYHLLMRLYHPDRAVGREAWTQPFASRINEAWAVLASPQSRNGYDEQLRRRRTEAQAWNPVGERAQTRPPPVPNWPHRHRHSAPPGYPVKRRRRPGSILFLSVVGLGLTALLLWAEHPDLTRLGPLAVNLSKHFGTPTATVAPGTTTAPPFPQEELNQFRLFPTNLELGGRSPHGTPVPTAGPHQEAPGQTLEELQWSLHQAETDLTRLAEALEIEEARTTGATIHQWQLERLRQAVVRAERLRIEREIALGKASMQPSRPPGRPATWREPNRSADPGPAAALRSVTPPRPGRPGVTDDPADSLLQ